jgi:PAS domain S-box-containing protein
MIEINEKLINEIKALKQELKQHRSADELALANKELVFQNEEKGKRADELALANKELDFQNKEKGKRADELALANTELVFQNEEKGKRADELVLANKELDYQNKEKGKRADELALANKELAFQNEEKGKRADELALANKELDFQNKEKQKRADELALANTELIFQNEEKQKRADELALANEELDFQNKEKGKRADELALANKELAFQNEEKGKRADELALANEELDYQNKEKGKRADELALANEELDFQNKEKGKRADELALANKELAFQNEEKGKRADELALANKELAFQNEEKKKRIYELMMAKELRQFIDNAKTPIVGLNTKGLINEWNHGAEEYFGGKKEEVIGVNWEQYVPKGYGGVVKKILQEALKGKQIDNYEFVTTYNNVRDTTLLVNTSARRDTAGKIIGLLSVGLDITKLVSYRNELEVKVEERTIKLNEALKKQKELGELKTKFVSTASHEFRTPLSAINFAAGYIKRYGDKITPSIIKKKLHKIEDQVLHMTQLLDDMLIVGQAEAGKMRNNPVSINLGNFIYDIIEEVESSSKESHEIELIDIENLKSGDIFIDEKLGRNIFVNLLSNALKFSQDAKKVVVELSSEEKYTVISITDFGIGIPKSEFKSIFIPFNRGKNVDLIQGTGLGLSIVKEAVKSIKGKIIVHSTVGEGTSFTVKIPKI